MRAFQKCLITALGFAACLGAFAAEDASAILATFSKAWPEARKPYRSDEDTASWKAYALARRDLIALGDKAVPALRAGCADKSFQVRALSAHVLGLLGAKDAAPDLIKLLDDPQPPVALQAADALGQLLDPEGLKALEDAKTRIKSGDVLLHISKALERKVPVEDDVREQVLKLNEKNIDAAKVGQPAPDFTLKDAEGKPHSLSDFKGKSAVVIVFVYGDG